MITAIATAASAAAAMIHRRRGRGADSFTVALSAACGTLRESTVCASALGDEIRRPVRLSMNVVIEPKRSAGAFAIAWRTAPATDSGTAAGNAGGCSYTALNTTSGSVAPTNAGL